MSILKLLATGSFISVNRYIAKAVSLEGAVMLGELASEHQYHASRGQLEDGYFYSTLENIEERTTLTRKKQDKAIKALTEKGIIDVKVKGCPPKRYFKINEFAIMRLLADDQEPCTENESESDETLENQGLDQFVPNGQIDMSQRDTMKCPKGATNNNIINNNKNNNINTYVDQVIDAYTTICKSLPRVTKMTDKRRKMILARLKGGFTIDDFKKAFQKAEASAFLRGETGRESFKPGIDWLLNESNLVKVLEGNYDDKPGGSYGQYGTRRPPTAEEQQRSEQAIQWAEARANAAYLAAIGELPDYDDM